MFPIICPGFGLSCSVSCVWSAGMLKIHSGGPSSQQTVLTIPANQLKQLGVGSGSGGLPTILMPVGKGTLIHYWSVKTLMWLWFVPFLTDLYRSRTLYS